MFDSASPVSHRHYASGIGVLWSDSARTSQLCDSIVAAAQAEPLALVIIWFSAARHDANEIVTRLRSSGTPLKFCGCSTSGEITPDGLQTNGFVAITLPRHWFQCTCLVLDNISTMGMETIANTTANLCKQFRSTLTHPSDSGKLFALSMVDGLSYAEEALTVAMDRGLDGIALIGGSAGDNLAFEQTWQIGQGQAYTNACVLTLVHCRLPCILYTDNNFVPTARKLVVTEANPDQRRVIELNAEPAAQAYAEEVGLDQSQLSADSFATYSLIVRFGGRYYCRSIQKVNDDGSLTFFCAIDKGLVLTVARSSHMVESSRLRINEIEKSIGNVDVLLGFDCVYRKLEMQYYRDNHTISSLYKEKHFLGFNTYGEQYGSMHVNQTFTGVAIAAPNTQDTETTNNG